MPSNHIWFVLYIQCDCKILNFFQCAVRYRRQNEKNGKINGTTGNIEENSLVCCLQASVWFWCALFFFIRRSVEKGENEMLTQIGRRKREDDTRRDRVMHTDVKIEF